jgi:hypothetical protein
VTARVLFYHPQSGIGRLWSVVAGGRRWPSDHAARGDFVFQGSASSCVLGRSPGGQWGSIREGSCHLVSSRNGEEDMEAVCLRVEVARCKESVSSEWRRQYGVELAEGVLG